MSLYNRRQLMLLLGLLAAAAAGLAVREWRQAHPDLVERLEQLDRDGPHETPTAQTDESARRRTGATAGPRPTKREDSAPLDLNRASAEELTRLPGVGRSLATRILTARDAEGRFGSVDDLRKIRGLGAARLERLRPRLTTDE